MISAVKCCLNDNIKTDEIGEACGTHCTGVKELYLVMFLFSLCVVLSVGKEALQTTNRMATAL